MICGVQFLSISYTPHTLSLSLYLTLTHSYTISRTLSPYSYSDYCAGLVDSRDLTVYDDWSRAATSGYGLHTYIPTTMSS